MTTLSSLLLSALYAPTGMTICAPFVTPLNTALMKYGIVSLNQVCAFLATVGVESQRLTRLSENLNYSATGLLKVFPSHFTQEQATQYARNPVAIANRVYANREGNGDEASGDGWRYRGAGLIGLTFKNEQAKYAATVGLPPEHIGDYLRTPEGAADSAGWYWATNGLNAVSAGGNMTAVTRVVNGGLNGLTDRVALFQKAQGLLK